MQSFAVSDGPLTGVTHLPIFTERANKSLNCSEMCTHASQTASALNLLGLCALSANIGLTCVHLVTPKQRNPRVNAHARVCVRACVRRSVAAVVNYSACACAVLHFARCRINLALMRLPVARLTDSLKNLARSQLSKSRSSNIHQRWLGLVFIVVVAVLHLSFCYIFFICRSKVLELASFGMFYWRQVQRSCITHGTRRLSRAVGAVQQTFVGGDAD